MFKFLGPKKKATHPSADSEQSQVDQKWADGLARTRRGFTGRLIDVLRGRSQVDEALWSDIQTLLLHSDMGASVVEEVLALLKARVKRGMDEREDLLELLKQILYELVAPYAVPFEMEKVSERPCIVLVVGVNGSGKTTTLGKLAYTFSKNGLRVMMAAGDTFRAAAIEQLQRWGERADVPVIAQHFGADAASVIFDASSAARARHIDVLLADTAGRLHNKAHLMQELSKIRRVLHKSNPDAPHEVLCVLDATCGQNALIQAEQFIESVGVTGFVLTKLDGTAKGGIVFALTRRFKLPIRWVGMGEGIEDLHLFDAKQFVHSLLTSNGEG